MSEEIKDIILDVKDSLNETPKNMYKYNKITLNLNEFEEILNYIEQLEKENKELNRMCELYGQSLYNADLTKAEKRVEQLENIRKEAIEYIENNWITYNDSKDFTEFNEELPVFIKEINILLNILNKGSEE